MILEVTADKPSFNSVKFKPGFNIILATTTEESSSQDTRNGVGKSSLLRIIDFCLGASVKKKGVLSSNELLSWEFTTKISINEEIYEVTRSTNQPRRIIVEGDFTKWPLPEGYDKDDKYQIFSDSYWKQRVGSLLFNLSEKKHESYHPTYRSLMRYSIRPQDAFDDAFKNAKQQSSWEVQVNNAYLLGLNWEYAVNLIKLMKEIERLRNVRKAIEEGKLAGVIETVGDLEAQRVQISEAYDNIERQLDKFEVLPQYSEIEDQANQLTESIKEITNMILNYKRHIDVYNDSLLEEDDISQEFVEKIYHEAGLVFSSDIKKKLTDLQVFHKEVLENRRNYLQNEIKRLENLIKGFENEITEKSRERAKLMEIMKSKGALDEYTKLQQRHAILVQKLEETNSKINKLREIESQSSKLKIEHEQLVDSMRQDLFERRELVDKIRALFNNNSNVLYGSPGKLSIDVNENGYRFGVEIERARSIGIKRMKTFCYDLALAEYRRSQGYNPDFLIHDSHIFDGVDSRQIGKAIELSWMKSSQENSFQYVCCHNSDIIPYDSFSDEFREEFKKSVAIELVDKPPERSLFGFRF